MHLTKQSLKSTVSKQLGQWAEQKSAELLEQAGYQIIQQNYHSRFGEIDLIALKDNELVFVEVKARTPNQYGTAIETVTLPKQKKIYKTALSFLSENEVFEHFYYRFDVICFDFNQEFAKNLQQDFSQLAYDHLWIENAFTLDADLINL